MSPFLAQVELINAAGAVSGAANATIKPEVRAQVDATFKALHALVDQAHAATDTALAEVQAKQNAKVKEDGDDSSDVTINNGTKSIVVHHGKSGGEDIPTAVIPIVAIFFVFSYLIIKALMAPFTNRHKRVVEVPVPGGLSEEEAAILEKLQRTLIQMESRVESLETILIDQVRTKEKYGTKL